MMYRARTPQTGYGKSIGIILLEEHIPCPPGTPGNPTTFSFPVCYEVATGVSTDGLRQREPAGLQSFIAAGQRLVERGVWGIAGNCGLMLVHQAALARTLPVPVFLSSLLQLPLIGRMISPQAAIGIVVSGVKSVEGEHMRLARIGSDARIAVASMEGRPHFTAAIRDEQGTLNFAAVQAEVVGVARNLVADHPEVKAILFECVDLPPYARAVQEAVDLPVFDITTLIGSFRSALVRGAFEGAY